MVKMPKKSLSRVIFSVFWSQKKWFGWIAVILLTVTILDCWGAPPTKDIAEKPVLFPPKTAPVSQIAVDPEAPNQVQQAAEKGFLGGPTVLGSLVGPVAQAAVDFSADDELEDIDSLSFQNGCLVSCSNPAGGISFPNYKREIIKYIVKQGDTPEGIAVSFNINTDTLLWANGLKDGDIIKPGQELIILPINGVGVKVSAKDTVESLAKKYNGVPMEIIAFNNLPLEGTLKEGDYIIIPGGEMPTPVSPKPAPKTPAVKKYATSKIPAGWLIIPTTGHDWGRIHCDNGVDIANHCSTPVYAAAAGKVIVADSSGYNGGYGKYIKIQHPNGVVTLYAHASQLLVSVGEQVAQGQEIMLMGTTGRSTGCHLHFEVRGAANPLAGRPRDY